MKGDYRLRLLFMVQMVLPHQGSDCIEEDDFG